MKYKIIEFEIEMFEEKIFVCISKKIDVLKKFFPKEDLSIYDKAQGVVFSGYYKNKDYKRVIWLGRWNIPLLCHEAYHVTKDILDHRGISDHETGAYMIDYIVNETMKRKRNIINKKGKKS